MIFNWRAASASHSLLPLFALTAIFAIGLSVLMAHGHDAPEDTRRLWTFEFSLMVALWVSADRRVRGFRVPYEFDAFVLVAWIFVLPYYLYRTRGRPGLVLYAGFWGLLILPPLAAEIARALLAG